MSIAAIGPNQRNYFAFCDKKFQVLRVIANTICQLSAAIFYELGSLLTWAFNRKISHHYHSLAYYRLAKAVFPATAFSKSNNRSQVIDFSINMSRRVKEIGVENELDELKQIYGDQAMASWSEIGNAKAPVLRDRLCRVDKGVCLGMSYDFISHYLKNISKGMSPLEAVKVTSVRYVEGAPDEAVLAQIFYMALDASEDKLKLKSHLNCGGDILWEYDLATETYQEKTMEALKWQGAERDKIIANKMGLLVQADDIYVLYGAERSKMDAGFQGFLNQLPDGAYAIGLCGPKSSHEIALIKTSEQYFVFDPNYGTSSINKENAAKMFWDLGPKKYLKNGTSAIILQSLALDK